MATRKNLRQCWIITFILAVSLYAAADPLTDANLPHSHRLLDALFRYYRKEVRPVSNDSVPVEVTVHLWFKQILKVYWHDDFLSWNPGAYGDIQILHVPADRIWRPDLMIYNNADMNIQENELTTNAVLNYTGSVMCFRAMITKITCNLDMKYFPFDRQNCSMMLASWSSDGSKVTVVPKKANNNLVYYIENTEWKLLEFMYMQQTKFYDCCPEAYPDITYYFVVERNPSYYILNLIIPSVFITVVTMVGFFTPYSSTGENTEKVSLGVTALLSLAIILLMVADKMPATSKVIPLIGKYYIGLIWLIFAATIITTVTLRLQSKGNAGKPLSENAKRIFFHYIARSLFMKLDLPTNPMEHSHRERDINRTGLIDETTPLELFSEVNGGVGETSFLLSPPRYTSCYYDDCARAVDTIGRTYSAPVRRHSMSGGRSGGHREPDGNDVIYSNNYPLPVMQTTPLTGPFTSPSIEDQSIIRPSSSTNRAGTTRLELETLVQLKKIQGLIRDIDQKLSVNRHLQHVRKEWEQLARVCERLLMFAFVFLTILFATLMLHFHGQGEGSSMHHQHTQYQQLQPPHS